MGLTVPLSAATRRELARRLVDSEAAPEPVAAEAGEVVPGILAIAAGDAGLRLYPGAGGAKVAIRRFVAGPGRFETGLRSSDGAPAVRFSVTMRALESGRIVDRSETVLAGGERRDWQVDLKFLFGDAVIELIAERVEPGSDEEFWAEFVAPNLN